jgi:hypothetical protein
MRFRKSVLALFACLALGAIAANAAQAEGTGWTVEEKGLLKSGEHEGGNCRTHGTTSLIFTSKLLGANVKLSASGIDCLERAGSKNPAHIDNTTSPNHSEGVLTFTGVKVIEPSSCTISEELTTRPLTDTVIMDKTAGSTVVFDKIVPETAGGAFFQLTFGGALCPIAEVPTNVTGSLCGEAVHTNAAGTGYEPNKTGELKKVQTLRFGPTQQTTGGCEMKFGSAATQLEGAVDNELVSGAAFGSD